MSLFSRPRKQLEDDINRLKMEFEASHAYASAKQEWLKDKIEDSKKELECLTPVACAILWRDE